MNEPKHGGSRKGSGRKPRPSAKDVTVRLSQVEYEAYTKRGLATAYFRYLLRKDNGLCLHGVQVNDLEKGEFYCMDCREANPENYSRFFITPETATRKDFDVAEFDNEQFI